MSGLASVSCDDEQSSTSATPFQFQKPTAQRAALHQTLAGLQATTLRKRVQKAERGGLKEYSGRGFADAAEYRSLHQKATYVPGPILGRFCVVAEVMVSKIFPAGFGWQGSSCVAEQAFLLKADDYMFFFVTGVGDFVGVLTGHTAFYALKRVYDSSISISDQFQVGWFLGSAAFCSGFLWQPFVNAFQAPGVGYSFTTACALTTIGCGSAFYVGLRAGRQVYPTFFTPGVVMGPDYGNLQGDMQLSLSVGGATGVFVGTDISYGTGNWIDPVLGIGVTDADSDFVGMVKAGTSTAIGFGVVQSVQNMVIPHGFAWLD